MGNRNAVRKREMENWETWLSYLSMDHFVQCIILYCVHLSLYTVPTVELNMPCLNLPLDPSLPHSHAHLYCGAPA